MVILIFLLILLLGTLIAAVFSINALIQTLHTGLPYVTTPPWAIDWMVQNLMVREHDVVVELGCGDARVLVALARRFPRARFLGIEIQWWPYLFAKWRTRKLRNIKIARGDLYRYDLSPAHLVYGFYITKFMDRLEVKLKGELLPGTKVISYGFKFSHWQPIQEIPNPRGEGSTLLIYER